VHLVGFTTEMYYDTRSYKRHIYIYKLQVSRPGYFTPGPPSTVELWSPKADTADVEKKKISCH